MTWKMYTWKSANDKLFVNHSDDEFVKFVEMSVITKKKAL